MPERKPISAEALRAKAQPVIAIPGFEPGETLDVRVRRASLLHLVSEGVIPNPLLPVLYKVISSQGKWSPMLNATPEEFRSFTQAMEAVCRAILVEPSYDEVGELLTDEQRMALFAFAQTGVVALKPFRRKQEPALESGGDGEGVQG